MKRAVIALLLLGLIWRSHAEEMETRRYHGVDQDELFWSLRAHPILEPAEVLAVRTRWRNGVEASLRNFLETTGVSFANGAYIAPDFFGADVIIRNTPAEHAKIWPLLYLANCCVGRIAVDASLVAFSRKDIEIAARRHVSAAPTMADLKALWLEGKGRLVCTESVASRSGMRAEAGTVDRFVMTVGSSSPTTTNELWTQDVGFRLVVVPSLSPDGRALDIALSSELTSLVGTNAFAAVVESTGAGARTTSTRMEQPVFRMGKFHGLLAMEDGSTLILGDLATRSEPEALYLFVTAHNLDKPGESMLDQRVNVFSPGPSASP